MKHLVHGEIQWFTAVFVRKEGQGKVNKGMARV